MREPGNSVCGARVGSQAGTGAPCGPWIEPAAAGEATADRGGDGIAAGRSSGAGERGPAVGCVEPVRSICWPADRKRGGACVPGGPGIDTGKRAVVWDGSGVADVAEQSVADDEERTGGCNAPASVCRAGPAV